MNLIDYKTDFYGWTQQQAEILRQQKINQVVSITGMGGIGKTELALQYALRYREQYEGGICWIEARNQEIALQIIS